jgi:hypothetical protein
LIATKALETIAKPQRRQYVLSMSDPKQRLRDVYPYNDSFNAMEVATADRRFEQLIERRERLIERSRFGVLALNGASAIGILSNYSDLRSAIGHEPQVALVFFASGMILGLFSIFTETSFVGYRAAQMFGHLSALRHLRATLDNHYNEQSERLFAEQLNELGERAKRETSGIKLDDTKDSLPNDFAYSPTALSTLNASGAAWMGGVIAMILGLLK